MSQQWSWRTVPEKLFKGEFQELLEDGEHHGGMSTKLLFLGKVVTRCYPEAGFLSLSENVSPVLRHHVGMNGLGRAHEHT